MRALGVLALAALTLASATAWTPDVIDRTNAGIVPMPWVAPPPSVRVVYSVPADRTASSLDAIRYAMRDMRLWYGRELDGRSFRLLGQPTVCRLPENSAYYSERAWHRVLRDTWDCAPDLRAFSVTWEVESRVWVVFADVAENCALPKSERGLGVAVPGLAMLGRDFLQAFAGHEHCGVLKTRDRLVGAAAHELGHALGLPHPPGCDEGLSSCQTGTVMWRGFAKWPDTAFLPAEVHFLLDSPFIRR